MDVLLGIVLFLLASFAAPEQCLHEHVEPPSAEHGETLRDAPLITVALDRILVDGIPVANTNSVIEAASPRKLDALRDVLKTKRDLFTQVQPGRKHHGTTLLVVDRAVPARVVKSVFHTAALAGYPHVSLVVKRRGVSLN